MIYFLKSLWADIKEILEIGATTKDEEGIFNEEYNAFGRSSSTSYANNTNQYIY